MNEAIKRQIDLSLKKFLNKARDEYHLNLVNSSLFNSLKEFNLRKGKRIRPLLLILSYQGYSKKNSHPTGNLYSASTCMELLHNFMLIHDDIVDRSDLRRGKPTLHRLLRHAVKTKDKEKLGYDLGIVAGDILYALAIDAFLSIDEEPRRKEEALRYFIKTAAFTAMGEFVDVIHGVDKISRITEKDVFLNYSLKTARYTFECPLVVGAILAGAKKDETQKLSRFGLLIGQAFQIQDDILGIFGSEKTIGKSILSDLAESKKTILVCHAYQKLSPAKKSAFVGLFSKPKKTYQDLLAVRKIFVGAQSLNYSLLKINSLLKQSKKIMETFTVRDSYRKIIWDSLVVLFKDSNRIAKANHIHIQIK